MIISWGLPVFTLSTCQYQTRSYQNISMCFAVTVMKSAKHSGKWKRFISLNAITTDLACCALESEQCWHLLSAFKRREIRHTPEGNMTWNVFVEKWFYAEIKAICISLEVHIGIQKKMNYLVLDKFRIHSVNLFFLIRRWEKSSPLLGF